MLITTENNCDMLHSYSKTQFEKNWRQHLEGLKAKL